MKYASLLLASSLLMAAGPSAAQSAARSTDPISGTWTGDIGLTLTDRSPLKFELKFDGVSVLSGTVSGPGPADFKTGTYDATTGALKLEVDVKDDGGSSKRFVFEGTAVNGLATGRVSDGTKFGSFRINRAEGGAAGGAQPAGDAAAALRKSFTEVSGWVAKAADQVPADKYGYQPTKAVRTLGQLLAHVADSYNYYCAVGAGRSVQWADPIEKGKTDKATVVPLLQQALERCIAVYAGNGQVGALLDNVAHTSLHYGNLITYLRLLGMAPPSS
jgi:uncharacterized damage-inducible protein DinB